MSAKWRSKPPGALTAASTEVVAGGELRPPVVTILGHVDHGKTTLLDSIRKNRQRHRAGIRRDYPAYRRLSDHGAGKENHLPRHAGHAAFTAMRARGANLTDIAVLVVAADDGIQPQTIEAMDHAKAAEGADHRGHQ